MTRIYYIEHVNIVVSQLRTSAREMAISTCPRLPSQVSIGFTFEFGFVLQRCCLYAPSRSLDSSPQAK